ncbi:MAG: ribosome maturation factor RimM [Gammaproteobacteria bacterium]|nr:ribosome maturation factor RimM [Gammaproteobacteria bacterium]
MSEIVPLDTDQLVVLGRISGLYGVRGWVKVFSYTEPRENILNYKPWYIRSGAHWQVVELAEGKRHGKGVVARLADCTDRDVAAGWMDKDIAIHRDQLPKTAPGEYYWSDLTGLQASTLEGVALGVVDHLISTGANDVLVIKGNKEHLVPFIQGQYVSAIDLVAGTIKVDWDPEF